MEAHLIISVALVGFFLLIFLVQWRKISFLSQENHKQKLEMACFTAQSERFLQAEKELTALRLAFDELKKKEGSLEASLLQEKKHSEEKLALLKKTQKELSDTFQSLSAEALTKSSNSFLQLASASLAKWQATATGDLEKRQQSIEAILRPVQTSITQLDQGMRNWEKERKMDQQTLKGKLQAMIDAERELKNEAAILAEALRAPIARGRWGEIQLKRIVELAGMVDHCDFYEQKGMSDNKLRPDLIVHLPGNKQVIIDAKTPSKAYLEAVQEKIEQTRCDKLRLHARHVRQHLLSLGKKAYWRELAQTPEFVILFIPSDNFFSAALQFEPTLIEVGIEQGVVIATPTTLIGLLRAIAYGWKQQSLSQHAEEIKRVGAELCQRLGAMRKHWVQMGKGLETAINAYNRAIGSFELRVLPSARKFQSLGVAHSSEALTNPPPIDKRARKAWVE